MDKSLQDKLLHSFPNTEFIGIIREYDSGRSGSPVFAIKFTLNNKYGLNGTFIVKIGSESWASAEQAFYNHSATDALTPLLARPHMPSLPIEGQVAVAYDVAFGSLIEPQPLMGILDQGNQSEREAQQQIRDFSRTLVDWYLGSDISRNSIVSDPHTLLFRMLTPKRTADMVEKLGKALPFWKPDAPQISVEGLNRRLPNPLAYMQKDTWSKIRYNPISPIGRIHGDLHTGNIMCLSKSKELPKVIDFGQSVPDGVPFFDLAYLEFDIMQHLLSVEQVEGREQWLSLLDFSMVGIVPKQQQMTWNAARAWRFIQPIRQQVKRLQAVDSESYEMVWWLSTVAVGLNFARKGDHTRSPFERMAGLLYAAYGLARILNMLHVKELITEYAAFIPWIQGKFSHPISSHESYSLLPDQKTQTSKVLSVPYRRNPLFTGREKLLKFLQKQITTTRAAALTQAQAISGLGGIGKTQVAVEYAYRYQQKYQAVLWVTAATRETIITDFVKLAALLHLSERYGANPSIVVAAVKEWLTSHTNWLLILDNVDDLKLVHEFLPTEINGHVLLTTRIQATGSVADAIAVDKMSSAEGIL